MTISGLQHGPGAGLPMLWRCAGTSVDWAAFRSRCRCYSGRKRVIRHADCVGGRLSCSDAKRRKHKLGYADGRNADHNTNPEGPWYIDAAHESGLAAGAISVGLSSSGKKTFCGVSLQ